MKEDSGTLQKRLLLVELSSTEWIDIYANKMFLWSSLSRTNTQHVLTLHQQNVWCHVAKWCKHVSSFIVLWSLYFLRKKWIAYLLMLESRENVVKKCHLSYKRKTLFLEGCMLQYNYRRLPLIRFLDKELIGSVKSIVPSLLLSQILIFPKGLLHFCNSSHTSFFFADISSAFLWDYKVGPGGRHWMCNGLVHVL